MLQSRVPWLDTAGYEVQHELALIGYAGGNAGYFAILFVPRAGWIASISPEGYSANPLMKFKRNDRVGLNAETADDLIDWAERRARFLPLLEPGYGRSNAIVRARAPLVTDGGKMLGWLQIEFPRAQWISAQIEPRLQAYVIVIFGFVLAGMVAVQRVQTQERQAARAAAAAAAQADRLKTAFLAKVSHELRTPIQSVLGYGDLLRQSVRDPAQRRQVAALREHGDLMLRLVNDLLDLSAIQAGAFRLVPRPTALVDLVQQTVESLRPRADAKGLALSIAVDAGVPPWAAVDRERVRQVVLNLVGNAIKFTDHGRVDVAMTTGVHADDVVLEVRDTGPGIPPEGLAKLFQPFERLDGTVEKEGTGLGLALTAGICRGMGGDVVAASGVDAGATFRAWFRAPRCAVPPNLVHSSGALPPLAGRHVLVVDDNALVRELFVTTLREAGAQCAAAEDGEQALAAVEREPFDALVLDLSMPRLNGLEVARRLRAEHRTMRIIGVSAHAGEQEKEEALAAGMDAFLVKPLNLDALRAAIVAQPAGAPAPEDSAARLIELLKRQFRHSAAEEGAALAAAIMAQDFDAAYTRAHHLMNSAAVIRDDRLFEACVTAEQAARKGDAAALQAAWPACAIALAPWSAPVDADALGQIYSSAQQP
jgi:signal transduction histidine kinase/CheY-like chemotaxis protein